MMRLIKSNNSHEIIAIDLEIVVHFSNNFDEFDTKRKNYVMLDMF